MDCINRNDEFRYVKRSDLLGVLANGLPPKSIQFGCQVVAIATNSLTSFPVVHLDDGTRINAKVIKLEEQLRDDFLCHINDVWHNDVGIWKLDTDGRYFH